MTSGESKRTGLLQGLSVFLSASVPNRPGFPRNSEAATEIDEAVVSFTRAVLAERGVIVFGAHPSISPLVASVASEYVSPELHTAPPPEVESIGKPVRQGPRVVIYQSHAYDGYVPDKTWHMYRFGYADLVWCARQAGETFEPKEKKVQCPHSLRYMRRKLFEMESPAVMAAIGGMEGVLDEADLFLEYLHMRDQPPPPAPIYALETTGGAAGMLRTRVPSFVHQVEEEWKLEMPPGAAEIELRSDPRARTFVPYPLIMQWLVRKIADSPAGVAASFRK